LLDFGGTKKKDRSAVARVEQSPSISRTFCGVAGRRRKSKWCNFAFFRLQNGSFAK
jgi:hypothetical protein